MYTLSEYALKTNYMMEQLRHNAIEVTLSEFKSACRRYYETCEGGNDVTRLFNQLEEYGVDIEELIDIDLAIRDEVFGG